MSGMEEVLAAHWAASTHSDQKPFVDKCDGCGEVIFSWGDPTVRDGSERLAAHQAAMLSAAGFGPVKEAAAVALEEAADGIEPHVVEFFKVAQDLNDPHRAWLRARAAAVRGEV